MLFSFTHLLKIVPPIENLGSSGTVEVREMLKLYLFRGDISEQCQMFDTTGATLNLVIFKDKFPGFFEGPSDFQNNSKDHLQFSVDLLVPIAK